jgi:hypothetical protein
LAAVRETQNQHIIIGRDGVNDIVSDGELKSCAYPHLDRHPELARRADVRSAERNVL